MHSNEFNTNVGVIGFSSIVCKSKELKRRHVICKNKMKEGSVGLSKWRGSEKTENCPTLC